MFSYVTHRKLASLVVLGALISIPQVAFADGPGDESQSGAPIPPNDISISEEGNATSADSLVNLGRDELGIHEEDGSDLNMQSTPEAIVPFAANVACNDSYTINLGGSYARVPVWMPSYAFSYDCYLERGAENYGVQELQYSLRFCNGQNIAVDGVFGGATEQAVKNVQYKHGLVVDGVYGPDTSRVMKWRTYDKRCLNWRN